jgi:hypothetical protein
MVWFTLVLFTRKVNIEAFNSIFIYCIILSIILFSYEEWIWWFSFKNLSILRWIPSTTTVCWYYSRMISEFFNNMLERKRSMTINMFLSLDIDSARICLFLGSIATHHNNINSESDLSWVSSTIMHFEITFLFGSIFWGWYFWIHFQIATWLLLTRCKNDNALDVFL